MSREEPIDMLAGRLSQISQRLNATRSFSEPQPSSRIPAFGKVLNMLRRWANWLATRWYAVPLWEQQARFNEQVTAAFDELARIAVEQEMRLRDIEGRLGCTEAPPIPPEDISSSVEALLRLPPEALREIEMADIPPNADTRAEAPLAATYDPELSIRDPFSWHQPIGWRYMFNLAVLGPALRCRPGDRVLDFAGGSGWVAEFLVRFGYHTVLLDYAEVNLQHSKIRFSADRRLEQYVRMDPVVGDGMHLPFADESFDGIVCMNAFHHMASYEATLREMARVLKPGCRVVFGEPGEAHARAPLTQQMMKEHGIFEKNVPLTLVYVYARRAGFARMWRYPYAYPDAMELPYPEEGKDLQTVLAHYARVLPGFLSGLSLFVLQKEGLRPLDSNACLDEIERHPLRAEITILHAVPEAKAGSVVVDRVRVKNAGDVLWLAEPRPMGGYVRLGIKLTNTEGRVLEKELERPFLPHDVLPGEEVGLEVPIRVPMEPGMYVLKYDMVDEFRTWFEACRSRPAERILTVLSQHG